MKLGSVKSKLIRSDLQTDIGTDRKTNRRFEGVLRHSA